MRLPLGLIFTIEVDSKPTVAFEARQLREAAELRPFEQSRKRCALARSGSQVPLAHYPEPCRRAHLSHGRGMSLATVRLPGFQRPTMEIPRRQAIILRSGGVVRLGDRSCARRPRLAEPMQGRGRWRRPGGSFPPQIVNGRAAASLLSGLI